MLITILEMINPFLKSNLKFFASGSTSLEIQPSFRLIPHWIRLLVAFPLNPSHRFARRGYSPLGFNLRMRREEIGSYLGLKLETISRAFSRLQEDGLINVNNKHIRLNDIDHLRRQYGNSSCK